MTRNCGPCTECCYVLGVHELGKRDFTHCQHEKRSSGGCGIYKTRPPSCAEFQCLWLGEHFDRKDRPDRVGIVFATGEMKIGQVVFAYVRKPGADKSGRGKELLDTITQRIPVCIVRWDGTRTIMLTEPFAHLLADIQRELGTQATVGEDGRLRRLPVV